MRGYFDAFSDVVDDQVQYFRSGEQANVADSHVHLYLYRAKASSILFLTGKCNLLRRSAA